MMSVEAVGVHPVEAPERCHLVELLVRDASEPLDLGLFTQDGSPQPTSNWQVPHDEHIVTASGDLVSLWPRAPDGLWDGDVRLVFFFHHLDLDRSLLTPLGAIALPAESPRPLYLRDMAYERP